MAQYSISEAARLLGIHRATLHRWIEKRVVPEPVTQEIAGSQIRYWTDETFTKLKQYKAEQYRKKPRRKARNGSKNS
jgi:excisionase family DNA binding protein